MRLLFAFVAALIGFLPGLAAAQSLAPHRAAYSLSLGDNRGQVGRLEGALVIDWAEMCEGYTLNQRMRFTMTTADEGTTESDILFSSFESKDGTSYRFTLRTARDGQVVVDRRAPGRGAWLCADRSAECARLAVRTRAVARALRLPVGAVPASDLGTLVVSVRTGVPDLDVARREPGGSMPMKG